jgi:hypothetical protein
MTRFVLGAYRSADALRHPNAISKQCKPEGVVEIPFEAGDGFR